MRNMVVTLLVFCVAATTLVHSQQVQLGYSYVKGTTYSYHDGMEGKTTQEVMGQEMKTEMVGSEIIRFQPDAIGPDGSMTMTATLDSAVIRVKGPTMDTTNVLQNLMGKKFHFTLSKSGQVSGFTPLDSSDAGMLKGIQNQLGKYPLLSDSLVGIGSKWTKSATDTIDQPQMGGRLVTNTKEEYTLAGKEQKNGVACYKLTSVGTVSITGSGSTQGVELKYDGSGKTAGTHFLDPKRGILVASESNVDLDMTIGAVGQQQMIIPMSQTMKMTRTLLEK